MTTFKAFTTAATLAALFMVPPLTFAADTSDPAARGRSNPGLSAEDESTSMPTNPNAGAGSVGTSGDPYAGGRQDEADDADSDDYDYEPDEDGY